ncbi:MAG: creatininase family protein [Rikenellaceae bacterium]
MSINCVRGIDLEKSSYHDIKQNSYNLAILPWGAIEPHNYHLPYLTDSILSHDIAVEAAVEANAQGAKSIVLPAVNFGSQNVGQHTLPFCIHTRYATQYAILCDVVTSLYTQGIKRLLIVNGHGGNNFKNMIRDLTIEKPDFLIATTEWYKIVKEGDFFENPGDHAGDLESSAMLHFHPELIDISTAGNGASKSFAVESLKSGKIWTPRNWQKVSNDTGIGDPRSATKEKGERHIKSVIQELSKAIVELSTSSELYNND